MISIIIFTILSLIIFVITFFKLIKKNNSNYIFALIPEFIGIVINFVYIFISIKPNTIVIILMYILSIIIPIIGFILEKNDINLLEIIGITKIKYYENKNQKEKVKNELLKNVQKYPNSYIYHKKLAKWYEENKEIEKAEYEYIKIVELKPKNHDNYIKLANVYIQNDKNEYQHIKQANVPGLVPKAQIIIGDDLANGESDTFLTNIKYGKTTIQQCDKNTENRTMQRKRKKYSWVQPTEACLTCGEGCNVFKNNKYIAYGRLFLYQNLSGNGGSPITVYIMGGTGIVTYALASIFTGHDFHGNPFNEKTDNEESEAACILSQIQDEIRDKYIDNFQKNLNGEETGNKNTKILEHVSDMIAPYFLPFLSKEDIHGLERSFEYYLHDLFGYNIRNQDSFTQGSTDETAEKKFLEDACEKAINTITKKLTEIISKKLFVEVVFKVEIEQDFNEKDYWTSLKKYSIKEYVINLVEV